MDKHERGQVATSAAEIYENFFVPALFAEWPEHVLHAAQLKPGDSVLDVACGTGVLAREANRQVGSSGTVTGIDINQGMLDVAQGKDPLINWQKGAAEDLPFEDSSFERVISQFGLMFFLDQVQAIREMARVLKAGGRMAVAVWGPLEKTPGYAAVAEMLDELFGPEVAKSIEAPYTLGEPEKLRALFNDAGINPVSIDTITGTARFDSIESWVYTDIKGWTLADIIDDAGYQQLKARAPEKLAPFVINREGAVAFDAPAHIVTVQK